MLVNSELDTKEIQSIKRRAVGFIAINLCIFYYFDYTQCIYLNNLTLYTPNPKYDINLTKPNYPKPPKQPHNNRNIPQHNDNKTSPKNPKMHNLRMLTNLNPIKNNNKTNKYVTYPYDIQS